MKKFVLSLRGGGSKVVAYLGIIKALRESGLAPAAYISSSAGSIVAVAAAAELDLDLIAEHLSHFLPDKFIDFESISHLSLASSEKSIGYAEDLVGNLRLEDLPTPAYLQVTNLSTGELEYFRSGNAAERAMTSALLPFVYEPRKIGEHYYTDGDILSGYGVKFAREELGIDTVIALQPERSTSGSYKPGLTNTASAIFQLLLSARLEQERRESPPSYVIRTPYISNNMMDFSHSKELLALGYQRGVEILPELRKLLDA